MRSVEIINRLESELGKSVITSNHAVRIAALRHHEQSYEQGFGRLFNLWQKKRPNPDGKVLRFCSESGSVGA